MTFAELHQGPEPLVLPNAWDLPSALAMVAAGFPALGTTSFAGRVEPRAPGRRPGEP
ncbi:isocitrate lyase/phosphoenolpyruvate mutase family protein [Amycolatopsis sp. PS_44_ISF1]|uniref:isocitrate lyase/phosphoenolpyruvate mutase family protein n=1 Tax=Amycolatopsis sp. PS_44_ISF1 TaxID=2974917 RepID=UPI0028E02147|nr:isocitrate lyase/phosphoenolpyruvate mutase family protein [Amycolatopsis sp. PS_44_ISF1]MDT8911940.1 isocitrate lyase/phosphoenolpyruvate mutase family protein [Amycolatopsis sp. PS_44_ISF1]